MTHSRISRLAIIFSLLLMVMVIPSQPSFAQQKDYAKWGKLAVEKVKEKYPNHKLVDYDYEGKIYISSQREQYNFELTIEADKKKTDVDVYVLVNPKGDQLIDIYLDER